MSPVRLQTSTPPEVCLGPPKYIGDHRVPALRSSGGFRIGSVARNVKSTRLVPSHGRIGSGIRRARRVTRVPRLSGLAVTFGLSWDVHGSWPPPRLCCPRPPRYSDPICPAPSHPATSRVALIRGAPGGVPSFTSSGTILGSVMSLGKRFGPRFDMPKGTPSATDNRIGLAFMWLSQLE